MGLPPNLAHLCSPALVLLLFAATLSLPSNSIALWPGTVEVEMKLNPSIYPCLDSYPLLVAKPDLSSNDYIRLIRIYVAQTRTTNLKQLDYVREYKLPPGNILNIACQSFSASYKYYCFVFVAINATSGAFAMGSRPQCRPTLLTEDDLENSVVIDDQEQFQAQEIDTDRHHLDTAGPSLNLRADTRYADGDGQSVPVGADRRHHSSSRARATASDEQFVSRPLDLDCHCRAGLGNLNLSDRSATTVRLHIHVSGCSSSEDSVDQTALLLVAPIAGDNGGDDQGEPISSSSTVIEGSSGSGSSMPLPLLADNDQSSISSVCVLNLTSGERESDSVVVELAWPLAVIDALGPSLKVRDGQLAVDPLLRIGPPGNGSIRHVLQSRYLRIESSRDLLLTLRFERLPPLQTRSGQGGGVGVDSGEGDQRQQQEQRQHHQSLLMSWVPTGPVHYSAFGFVIFSVAAICIYTLVWLSVRVRKPKVQIMEAETLTSEPPPTSESQVGQSVAAGGSGGGAVSDRQSDFSFGDGDSLELDYYDYHATLLPHSKSVTFANSQLSDENNDFAEKASL